MSGNVKRVFLTKEIIGAIAQAAADIVETQLALDDRLEIDPDQLNKLADKISTRLDAKVNYDQIKKNAGFNDLSRRISDLKRELTDQDRIDIAEQILTELDLSEEIKSTLARSFVSKSFFNQKIGGLMQLARDNKGRAMTAGISGKEMIEEINKVLGTDWQTGGGAEGDMLKSVYDTNDDGKVEAADAADSVPWDGVTDKPTIGDMLKSAYDTNDDGKVNEADAADSVPWDGVTDKPAIGDMISSGSANIGEVAVADSTDGKQVEYAPVLIDSATGKVTFITTQQLANHYIQQNREIVFTNNGLDSGISIGRIGVTSTGLFRVRVGSGQPVVLSASGTQIEILKKLILSGIPSGATQGAAGAAANEIWNTSGHATLPDNVLMIGV